MFSNPTKSEFCTVLAMSILVFASPSYAQKIVTSGQPEAVTILDSTKERDGLMGSVRRVKTESARLQLEGERVIEGKRDLLEVTTYGPRGDRIENVSYPSASSVVGKEEYKYDNKGNIVEMTLRDENGTILSREAYDYEFDRFGNWTKMITSLLVFEGGSLKREPVEVTYRTLTYYFDDQIAKIVEPATVEPASAGKMPELPAAKELEMSTNPALAEQHITVFSLDTAVAQLTSHLGPPPDLAREGDEKQLLTPPHANQTDDSTVLSSLQIEHTESVSEENNLAPSRAVNEAERSSAAEPNTLISSSPPAATSESEAKGPAPSDHAAAVKGYEYFEAGRQRFNEGDLKGAVAAYLQSIELQPDSVEAHLSLGLTYLKMGKNKDAAKAFKESVRLGPEVAEAQYGLGLAYFRLARQRDAAEAFKRATTLSPKMAKAHYGLALAYQELGKTDALTEEFRILQTLDAALAKQLSMTFPESIVPCNSASRCK